MAKSIPEVKIGNEVYQIKDRTAREHLVEVSTTQPSSEDNKLWIKNQEAEYEVPTLDEFNDLKSALDAGNIMTKPGHFTAAEKLLNWSSGVKTIKYNGETNGLLMAFNETQSGTKTVACAFNQASVPEESVKFSTTDYKYVVLNIYSNLPNAAAPKFRFFIYRANGTGGNEFYVNIQNGTNLVIVDIPSMIESVGKDPTVYTLIEPDGIRTSSYTYSDAPVCEVRFMGMFTSEEAENYNLAISLNSIKNDILEANADIVANDQQTKKYQEMINPFNGVVQTNAQMESTIAEGLQVNESTWTAETSSYNSYGFVIPEPGSYYFSSSGVVVSEEMTENGQTFTKHKSVSAGTNTIEFAGYYYKLNTTSIYAYKNEYESIESVFGRGSVSSNFDRFGKLRYTISSTLTPDTVSALILTTNYVGSFDGSYRIKRFAVTKGYDYVFSCNDFSVSFDTPLMMFVKNNKSASFGSRVYGFANPDYVCNKTKEFEIAFHAPANGYVYIQTNNADTLTINGYQVTGIETIPTQNPQYKKMLTIGDSLTSNGIWQPVVRNLLFIPQSSTVAVAGKCISKNGDDPIYDAVMALTADSDVDLVTLWAGTNDFAANVTLSTLEAQIDPETRDNTTFYGGVLDCVEHLITLYPQKRFIMIGTTPRTWNNGNSDYQHTPNGSGKYLRDFVDAFHNVAQYYGLPFLDLLRTSGINLLNITQFMQQQKMSGTTYYLHPTTAGYKYIGGLIAAFLKSVG